MTHSERTRDARRRRPGASSQILSLALLPLLALAGAGCGGDAEEAPGEDAPAAAAEATAPAEAPAESPAPAAAEAPPTVTEPPALTSLVGAGVVEAGDLRSAYTHLLEHSVVVAGHPLLYTDESAWPSSLKLTAEPGAEEHLVECRFDAKPEGTVQRTETAVVRGTFARRRFDSRGAAEPGAIVLTDCSLVSVGDDFTPAADPWAPGDDPVPAADLHRAMFGWQGEAVRVRGRYQGSAFSSASGETRHDLENTEGRRVIECMESGETEAPQWAIDQREGVVVEGAVGENLGDRITLTGCRFVEGA